MSVITINEGTQTGMFANQNGTIHIPYTKLDAGVGTVRQDWNGTIPFIGNLNTGTIARAGTLQAGTVDTISQLPPNNWATTVNTGTSTLGTIKAAVSGSQIFVTDLVISVGSATNVEIASGGTSTPIVGTMFFNANGGAVLNYRTPIATVAGSALVFKQSAAISPITITAQGFVR